jgi:CBS domain-containing protein
MRVGKCCTKETISVGIGDTISRVAQQMRENNVGAVLVERDGRPIGIVTDRDIALRCGGRREALADIPVHEVMSRQVFTANEDEDVLEVLEKMREHGVRRVPVVNDGGLLAGMITLDDILLHVARSVRHVADVVMAEIGHEA